LAAESQAALDRLRELGPERLGEFDFAAAPQVRFIARDSPAGGNRETQGS
jgi:hypothetical protein